MRYTRKGIVTGRSKTLNAVYIYKPSLWSMKFLRRKPRNIRGRSK